jgi:very-short-patch-repair endonuclease
MDNTEGTPQPGDAVETTREASTREATTPAHGSNCPYCGVLAVSSTEALLNKAFRKLSISFSTQQLLLGDGTRKNRGYAVDLLVIQRPVVVEADELYHQVQHEQRAWDAERDAQFRAAGYEVFRFMEQEIGQDADACAIYVAEQAGLIPEAEPAFSIRKAMSGPDSATWTGGKLAWDCLACGAHFHSYKRGYGKPCTTCSRECQRIWQMESGASTRNRRSNGVRMRELWNDPEWRAEQTSKIASARWGSR